jgi:hypothetical protein
MQKYTTAFILLTSLMVSTFVFAQPPKSTTDYFRVPGPIMFGNRLYNLSWSSHPAANFYKQEYTVKGSPANNFSSMILLDAFTGDATVKNIVEAKIAELKKMKETNPVINYELIENPKTGEYLIDFLVTANTPEGTITVAERNVYRYKTFVDKANKKCILLFGVSTRGYGADVTRFLSALKAGRKELVAKVAQFKMPEPSIIK